MSWFLGLRSAIGADFEWFHFVWEMKILDLSEHFSAAAGSASKLHLMSTLMSRAVVCWNFFAVAPKCKSNCIWLSRVCARAC
jgi:hypothetical protein